MLVVAAGFRYLAFRNTYLKGTTSFCDKYLTLARLGTHEAGIGFDGEVTGM